MILGKSDKGVGKCECSSTDFLPDCRQVMQYAKTGERTRFVLNT